MKSEVISLASETVSAIDAPRFTDGADRSYDPFEPSQEAGGSESGDPPLEANARQGATISGEERERVRRIEAEEVRRILDLLSVEWYTDQLRAQQLASVMREVAI